MKNKYLITFLLLILFFRIDVSVGQVTMGESGVPMPGSILQLQNLESNATNLINANKGLLLPRVKLTDINNLYPMFAPGYDKTEQDLAHAGLLVFNVNEDHFNGDGKGVYSWSGKKWNGIGLTPRSINVSPKIVYLSKNKLTGTAEIAPSIPGLQWEETVSGIEDSSTMTLDSNGDIKKMTFNRSNTVFGNKTYTFTLKNNPDRATELQVANLELVINTPLFKVGVGDKNGIVQSSNAVTAHGGQEKWEVISYSKDVFNWDIPPKLEDGKLTFQLGEAKMAGNIEGEIIVAHIDDKSLTGKITVRQNSEFKRLPDFDYIVAELYAQDGGMNPQYVLLCLTSEVRGTGHPEVDYQFVGYQQEHPDLNEPVIIMERYANTNKQPSKKVEFLSTSRHRESYSLPKYAVLNMSLLANEILTSEHNREFKFQSRAAWFWPTPNATDDSLNKATVSYTFYKGGRLVWDEDQDFPKIVGGILVDQFSKKDINVRKASGEEDVTDPAVRDRLTQPLYEIEYDFVEKAGLFLPMEGVN
ncbi:hypothetical protein NWE55_01295 [Myroides albus]|uniref:hypothetical protein n=1 Tax=Myroides albus TaxID=2562892 RepID=UPI0021598F46|nr:hypothetical protein [Myroides albus]UVD79955.1 hypothetical protein NWE55_01295 [Myroides albus]